MIVAYIISYLAAFLFARAGQYILSGLILILAAIALYVSDYLKTGNLMNLRGLFALSFIGGEGVSCLKLSNIQTDWEFSTWICFFLAFMSFYLVYEFIKRKQPAFLKSFHPAEVNARRCFFFPLILTAVSLVCFLLEVFLLGYVPLFVRGVPHAYSYFHVSGVHYFTVLCVLVPAAGVQWFFCDKKKTPGKLAAIAAAVLIALSIPVLCVSRFQFFSAVVLAVFAWIVLAGKMPVKIVLPTVLVLAAAYLLLSVARSHDADYLNSIFEMKYQMPVNLSRIYIYIANNYDNFDCMVKQLPAYAWGMKGLFPVWALSGLKFVFPQLVNTPFYLTKPELTTLTLIYDFYYDFGIIGVVAGMMLIAFLACCIEYAVREKKDKNAVLLYVQFALYLFLAFFTTWFSNPTVIFYFVITLAGYFFCRQNNQ